MKYLDREPRKGDRVHVEYTATVTRAAADRVRHVHFVTTDSGVLCHAPADSARVIAPEPQVGDVVTADMDLPEESIIGTSSTVAFYWGQSWYLAGGGAQASQIDTADLADSDMGWRIVRIGAAS